MMGMQTLRGPLVKDALEISVTNEPLAHFARYKSRQKTERRDQR